MGGENGPKNPFFYEFEAKPSKDLDDKLVGGPSDPDHFIKTDLTDQQNEDDDDDDSKSSEESSEEDAKNSNEEDTSLTWFKLNGLAQPDQSDNGPVK